MSIETEDLESKNIYTVKTDVFEGPLEVLLSLIEKRKLFINDISLAVVADDYIQYAQKIGKTNVGATANFIMVASTLILIKSKSLLPTLELSKEEEGDILDLEQRLKEYKRIKELSLYVRELFGSKIIFPRSASLLDNIVFVPDKNTTKEVILMSIRNVIHSLPKKEVVSEAVVRKVISLEDTINNLTDRIQVSLSMSFKEFVGIGKKDKVEIVVGFLAMLELVKQGLIDVAQEGIFSDINMESTNVDVPRYT